MQTVLFVSHVSLGDEVDIRRVHELFPTEAVATSTELSRMQAYIGSGNYVLELTFNDGDFQERFHGFVANPAVQAFFDELRPYIEHLPTISDQTAHIPLVSPIMTWESGLQS